MTETKQNKAKNFFWWEKSSNGRWGPVLAYGEAMKPASIYAKHSDQKDKGNIIRTTIQEVDSSLSLSECMVLHPLRSE